MDRTQSQFIEAVRGVQISPEDNGLLQSNTCTNAFKQYPFNQNREFHFGVYSNTTLSFEFAAGALTKIGNFTLEFIQPRAISILYE